MTRNDYRALLGGVALAAAGLLLVEVLGVRLIAATLGRDFALVGAVLVPAAAGLGAVVFAGRDAGWSSHELCARAAHRAAGAGALAVGGGIGITWASQGVAKASGEVMVAPAVVALASVVLPALATGSALGLVVRRAVRVVGRVGFAEGLGVVVGCGLLPAAMAVGAPRSVLALGLVYAGSAFAFAFAGRAARPQWTVMWTLPLATVSLIAGDVGAPWMKVRTDDGRRSQIERQLWTTEGAVGIRKPRRGRLAFQIDGRRAVDFADGRSVGRKPPFDPVDLAYLADPPEDRGAVLVIASGGGREVDAALAHGYATVDVIEPFARLVALHYEPKIVERTANVLGRDGVGVSVDDGLRLSSESPRDYQHIIVVASGRPAVTPGRLLSHHERPHTVESIRGYLGRLREDGSVLLRVPKRGQYAVIAAAEVALGSAAPGQIVACAGKTRTIVVVARRPLAANKRELLLKRCRRSRLDQVVPPPTPRPTDDEEVRAEAAAHAEALRAAVPPRDDRPFFAAAPGFRDLPAAMAATVADHVAAPRPEGEARGSAAAGEQRASDTAAGSTPNLPATVVGVASVGAGLALLLLLVGTLIPAPRSRDGGRAIPCPVALRYCFSFLGVAVALCLFALGDRTTRVCGDATYAWTIVVPCGALGLGSGRLWVDTLPSATSRRSVMVALAVGLVWLLALHVTRAPLDAVMQAQGPAVRVGGAATLLIVSGVALGFPMAASLRYLGQWDRVPVGWAWGHHRLGQGFGFALAALLVHYVGVTRLWPLGVATFAVGSVLLTLGAQRVPSSRWYLRRLERRPMA
ncbi:MAG: hypothetical protein AAGN82_23515 [Myxococcota bacterium]